MKYLNRALFISLFCYHTTYAQTTTAIKGGLGIASFKYKYGNNYPARGVWYSGVALRTMLKNQLFFQPELLYSLRGYHENADTYGNSSGNVSYGYLSMPLLIGYKPTKNLSLMAGPEPGYMLFAQSHFNSNRSNIVQYVNYRFSVDATVGAAYNVSTRLAIEARLVAGMTSLYKVVYTDMSGALVESTKSGRNKLVQIGISYTLQ